MAKKPKTEEPEAGGEEAGGGGGKKKLIIMGGGGLAALLILGGVGGYFMGFFGGGSKPAAKVDAHGNPIPGGEAAGGGAEAHKEPVFLDLPEMTVNLSALDGRATYLKVKVALEVSDKEIVAKINPVLPRVLDAFQVYLRELRASDLDGSAGLFRVKEELQKRINIAIYPGRVDAVLFREIIIQ